MKRAVVALTLALAAGCADGRSVVTLTVTASDTVSSIDHLQIVATDVGHQRSANAVSASVPGGTLPPSMTLSYALPKTVRGAVHFAITAVGGDGTTLASGAGDVTVAPSTTASGSVTLTPNVPPVVKRHLAFTVPPPAQVKPYRKMPAFQVSILDDNNMPIAGATDAITVALDGNAFFYGHKTVAATAGVASFSDVIFDFVATGQRLTASATGLDPVSAMFDVVDDVWVPLGTGMDAGSISGMCFDPAHPMTIWAVSGPGGGLWRSADGGASWARRDWALPNAQTLPAQTSCAVSHDGGTLLVDAVLVLYRSHDEGATWDKIGNGLPAANMRLVLGPNDDVYASSSSGLYKSTDMGSTFTALSTQMVGRVLVDPMTPTTVWAVIGATTATYTIEKSTDGGAHFAAANSGLPAATVQSPSLAIAPSNPQTLYVNYTGTGGALYKTTNGGTSWTSVLAVGPIASMIVDPASPTTLYAMRLNSPGYGPMRSTDGGATWTPMAGFPISTSATMYLDGMQRLWAHPSFSSPYLAADRMTFTQSSTGMRPQLGSVLMSTIFNSVWAATFYDGNVFHTSTGGTTWQNVSMGLNPINFPTITLRLAGNTVFDWDYTSIYKTTDPNGASWTTVFDGTTAAVTFSAVDFDASGTVLLAIDANNAVEKSTNGGSSFATTGATIAAATNGGHSVFIDKTNNMNAFITSGGVLYKTTNGGTMFTDVSPDPTTHPQIDSFAIDPVTSTNLYLSTSAGKVYKSSNGAMMWSVVGMGLPAMTRLVQILVDPITPSTLYVLDLNGLVYKSTDGAASFVAVASPPVPVNYLAIDPQVESRLIAATWMGPWRTTTGAQ